MAYLYGRRYLTNVITNVFLSSAFKGDFGAYNANKHSNFILSLVYLVTAPTEQEFHSEISSTMTSQETPGGKENRN